MPLMVCLLRHFSDLNIQDTLPSEQLHNSGADISRIKYYRNYISHSYNGKVTENTFTEIWNCAVEVSCAITSYEWSTFIPYLQFNEFGRKH